MSRYSLNVKQKRKLNTNDNSDLVTEDSSDNLASDVEYSKNKQAIDHMHEDSNDSSLYGQNNSFNDTKDKRLRQRQSRIKSSDDSCIRLQQCLEYIHRTLSRKDKEDFFQYPVTDLIAPGYSSIIKKPMDFSSMKRKIDSHAYNNILEYRDDFVLMCENAMTYNKSDTIYYHAARKLLDNGLKMLAKDKLISLRRTVAVMKNLTSNELGFVPEGESEPVTPHHQDVHRKRGPGRPLSVNTQISRSVILQKLEALNNNNNNITISHYEVPHETPEQILSDTQEAAKQAAEKLAKKYPKSQLGYLRRNSNGTSSLKFLDQKDFDTNEDKQLTIGNLCEGLDAKKYSMSSFIEEKKDKAKPMYYLENGPFSSHAPSYDSAFSNVTKEQSDMLLSIYGDEIGAQYALSLMEFSQNTGSTFQKYVNYVLNSLSNNEHERYLQTIQTEEAIQHKKQVETQNTTSINQNRLNGNYSLTNINDLNNFTTDDLLVFGSN